MNARSMNVDDPLEDFTQRAITLDGVTKTVHVAGGGPAVIVMTEMPGISPQVARFTRWVRDAGLTVYLPSLLAPVLCQPTLPLDSPGGLEIAPEALQFVRQRLDREDLTVLAYRFEGDKFCTAQRFAAYADALGERFVARVLPDSAANREVPPFFAAHVPVPHSVVTVHLIDQAGQPTLAARDETLSFFIARLGARTTA